MGIYKQSKDRLVRAILGNTSVPRGLAELHQYFRMHGPISFRYEQQEDGTIIAMSNDFHYGSIITQAADETELEEQVKDAILTAFEVPSSYAQEAGIHRVGQKGYAFA